MLAAVVESDNQHPAGSLPAFIRFPDVAVLVCGRVVTQTAAARVDRFFDDHARFARIALNLTRNRKTGGEDRQALFSIMFRFVCARSPNITPLELTVENRTGFSIIHMIRAPESWALNRLGCQLLLS